MLILSIEGLHSWDDESDVYDQVVMDEQVCDGGQYVYHRRFLERAMKSVDLRAAWSPTYTHALNGERNYPRFECWAENRLRADLASAEAHLENELGWAILSDE